jgi:hypothetical protein
MLRLVPFRMENRYIRPKTRIFSVENVFVGSLVEVTFNCRCFVYTKDISANHPVIKFDRAIHSSHLPYPEDSTIGEPAADLIR